MATVDYGIKPERLLGTFVPGALLVFGTWYFHRPFLLQRFPIIAAEDVGADTKALLFLVLAISAGVLIQHLADIAVVALVGSGSKKHGRIPHRIGRTFARLFSVSTSKDPRITIINRYLTESPRRGLFLQMVSDWAGSNADLLNDPKEQVIVHQHLVAHMKVRSDLSRSLIDEIYYEVLFAASLFTALALLLPISLLSLWTRSAVKFASFGTGTYLILSGLVWCFGIIAAYSVKRQFREFCSQVVTLALHVHSPERMNTPPAPEHSLPTEQMRGLTTKIAK